MEDSYGSIWIATEMGSTDWILKQEEFRNFEAKDGVAGNGDIENNRDNHKTLWLSTANGLFNIIVKTKLISYMLLGSHDRFDGLREMHLAMQMPDIKPGLENLY